MKIQHFIDRFAPNSESNGDPRHVTITKALSANAAQGVNCFDYNVPSGFNQVQYPEWTLSHDIWDYTPRWSLCGNQARLGYKIAKEYGATVNRVSIAEGPNLYHEILDIDGYLCDSMYGRIYGKTMDFFTNPEYTVNITTLTTSTIDPDNYFYTQNINSYFKAFVYWPSLELNDRVVFSTTSKLSTEQIDQIAASYKSRNGNSAKVILI